MHTGEPFLGNNRFAVALILFAMLFVALPAQAQVPQYAVLFDFAQTTEGSYPDTPLILDSRRNLFGAAAYGGADALGVVFKLAPDSLEHAIYSFKGGTDGALPVGLMLANDGNFYGTTYFGGDGAGGNYGTVFKLSPKGSEQVLYAFTGQTDGSNPLAGLVMDSQGNLYGTLYFGSDRACGTCGAVFKVTPDGTETVFHNFPASSEDGRELVGGLAIDSAGNLYGTTLSGGSYNLGAIFELTPDGTESILYNFTNETGGPSINNTLILDQSGNLYGTATQLFSYGSVYKFAPSTSTLTTLYTFGKLSNGAYPEGPLSLDSQGNLYGTTIAAVKGSGYNGTVFKITAPGKLTTLHRFKSNEIGQTPSEGVTVGAEGTLYGTAATTAEDGAGIVFSIMP